jgi:hypothetical protein
MNLNKYKGYLYFLIGVKIVLIGTIACILFIMYGQIYDDTIREWLGWVFVVFAIFMMGLGDHIATKGKNIFMEVNP